MLPNCVHPLVEKEFYSLCHIEIPILLIAAENGSWSDGTQHYYSDFNQDSLAQDTCAVFVTRGQRSRWQVVACTERKPSICKAEAMSMATNGTSKFLGRWRSTSTGRPKSEVFILVQGESERLIQLKGLFKNSGEECYHLMKGRVAQFSSSEQDWDLMSLSVVLVTQGSFLTLNGKDILQILLAILVDRT